MSVEYSVESMLQQRVRFGDARSSARDPARLNRTSKTRGDALGTLIGGRAGPEVPPVSAGFSMITPYPFFQMSTGFSYQLRERPARDPARLSHTSEPGPGGTPAILDLVYLAPRQGEE